MPRNARRVSATNVYHVMVRGLNKMPVFQENVEKKRILSLIRENLSNFDADIYAYCIMPNHLHLLIKADLHVLASFMASILTKFAFYYHYKYFSELYYHKQDLLSDEGYSMIAHRFQNRQQFLEFHNVQSWDIFDDTEEDIYANQLRIAKEICAKYQEKYDTTLKELLDYACTRRETAEEIRTVLKLSEKKTAAIIKIIQEEQKRTG